MYDNRLRELGLNIAYYRKMRGITQIQLAQMVDISRTHISNIEAPKIKKSVSIEIIFRIADALMVPVNRLFEFKTE